MASQHLTHAKGRGSTTRPAFHKSNQHARLNTTSTQKFQAIQNRIAAEADRFTPGSEMHTWLNCLGGLA